MITPDKQVFFHKFHRGHVVCAAFLCIAAITVNACSGDETAVSAISSDDVSTPTEKANVVLIIVDTLRADRLDMKRNETALMPFMRSFAEESWNFTNATAQATWTRPSMASLFTSLYSGVHNQQFGIRLKLVEGQDHTVDVLPETIETMATYLKKAGYITAGIQANWNMEPVFGVAQGFDSYVMIPHEQNAADVTTLSLNTLSEMGSPFFLYVHYIDPHAPYEPPAAYRGLFGELPEITPTDRELLADYGNAYYAEKMKWDFGFRETPPINQLSDAGKEYVKIMYDGEVRFTDDELARLITYLKRAHPDTIIIFSADHGEELWERGSIGHGKTVYEEVAHVPLLLSFPNKSPKTIINRVELIDILPTVAAYLSLPIRDWWQGSNLLDDSTVGKKRTVYTQTRSSVREANLFLVGVLRENWKLIFDVAKPSASLFNLETDPIEESPIVNEEILNEMRSQADLHLQQNRQHPLYAPPTTTRALDAETEEMLRSQGYL